MCEQQGIILFSSSRISGLPRSGKSQGKSKIFQGQGKVREFCKRSGKISVLVKVSEKSGNFVFRFCEVYEDIFGKKEVVVDRVMRSNGGFFGQSNAIRSKSREKRKEIENGEKNIDGLQKKLKLM